jgi:hypothetical protein
MGRHAAQLGEEVNTDLCIVEVTDIDNDESLSSASYHFLKWTDVKHLSQPLCVQIPQHTRRHL